MKAFGSTGSGGPLGGADTLVPTRPHTFRTGERWTPRSPFADRTQDDSLACALAALSGAQRMAKPARQRLVDQARDAGASWEQVAVALGISKQGAYGAYHIRRDRMGGH